jgi:hypothetical protein
MHCPRSLREPRPGRCTACKQAVSRPRERRIKASHLQVARGIGAPLLLLSLAGARRLPPLPRRRHVRLGCSCAEQQCCCRRLSMQLERSMPGTVDTLLYDRMTVRSELTVRCLLLGEARGQAVQRAPTLCNHLRKFAVTLFELSTSV